MEKTAITTGEQFLRFYNDPLFDQELEKISPGNSYYWEDFHVAINGVHSSDLSRIFYGDNFEFLQADDEVEILGGWYVTNKSEKEHENGQAQDLTPLGCGSFSIASVFLAWQQRQLNPKLVAKSKATP